MGLVGGKVKQYLIKPQNERVTGLGIFKGLKLESVFGNVCTKVTIGSGNQFSLLEHFIYLKKKQILIY